MDKGLYKSPTITPGGFVNTTSDKMPVCFADKVAVEATGTDIGTRNFVSLETKLIEQDEKLEEQNEKLENVASALDGLQTWENYND